MAKNLRAIVVKGGPKPVRPEWAKSTHSSAYIKKHMPEQRHKLDRGAKHEPNFTAQIVPVYNRAADRMGYNADTSETYDSMDPFSDQNSDYQQGRVAEGIDEMKGSESNYEGPITKFRRWRDKKAAEKATPTNLTKPAPKDPRPDEHNDPRPRGKTPTTWEQRNKRPWTNRVEDVNNVVDAMLEDGYSPELIVAMFETPEFIEEFEQAIEEATKAPIRGPKSDIANMGALARAAKKYHIKQKITIGKAGKAVEEAVKAPIRGPKSDIANMGALARAAKKYHIPQKITVGSRKGLKEAHDDPEALRKARNKHHHAALEHGKSITPINKDPEAIRKFNQHRKAEKAADKLMGKKDSLA